MRANHRHWTVFASICLLLLLVELQFSCGSAPHDLVNRVPIGSKLSELDRYLNRGSGSYGEVIEWARADKLADRSAVQIQNEFGLFIKKDKGFYDQWQASKQERDRFSGEIRSSLKNLGIPARIGLGGEIGGSVGRIPAEFRAEMRAFCSPFCRPRGPLGFGFRPSDALVGHPQDVVGAGRKLPLQAHLG